MDDGRSPDLNLNPGLPDYKTLQYLELLPSTVRRSIWYAKGGDVTWQSSRPPAVEGRFGSGEFLLACYNMFFYIVLPPAWRRGWEPRYHTVWHAKCTCCVNSAALKQMHCTGMNVHVCATELQNGSTAWRAVTCYLHDTQEMTTLWR